MYTDDLIFWGELKEELREMVGCFEEVFSKRGLKVNSGKRNVINGAE